MRSAAFVLLTLVSLVRPALAADDVLPQVKDLYNAAEYDRVLLMVGEVEASAPAGLPVELREYRALSLLALSRTAEAEQVVAALFEANPLYAPAANAPPRWKSLVDRVKVRARPEAIRKRYESAKRRYDDRDFAQAVVEFDRLKDLLAAANTEGVTALDDLITLTDGFLQLSRAALAPPVPQPQPAVVEAAPVASVAAPRMRSVTPPVAIKKDFPKWEPPAFVNTSRPYEGRIAVMVNGDGSVAAVRVLQTIHPTYDGVLIAAARKWQFEPATQDGKPIAYEVEVPVRLTAPRTAAR